MAESLDPEKISSPENLRALDDLVLITSTLYLDDKHSLVRQELALKLLKNAERLGIRCIVGDGGSNESFLAQAKEISGVTIIHQENAPMMGSRRRQALEEALKLSGAKTFLWTEPEKDTLITEVSLGDMIEKIHAKDADIVVPRRMNTITMPEFQRKIEARANRRATAIMHGPTEAPNDQEVVDLWFGPKMFNKEGAAYFASYINDSVDKWDSIITPVVRAYQDGKKIVSVDVDYTYDSSQVDAEEGDRQMRGKRLDQYRQILATMGDPFWSQEGKGVEAKRPVASKLKKE